MESELWYRPDTEETANYGSGSAGLKGETIKPLLKAEKIKTKTEETSLFGIRNPPDGNIPLLPRCGIHNC